MKTLLTTLILLITITTISQTRLSLSQDAKLAFIGDDIGNDAFTPNFTIRGSHFIEKDNLFNFFAYGEYEYADLKGGSFNKAAIGFGLSFDYWIKNFEFQVLYGVGKIYRHGDDFSHWDLSGQIAYKITDNLQVIAELQQTKRTDLKKQPFIYSFRAGLRISIFN